MDRTTGAKMLKSYIFLRTKHPEYLEKGDIKCSYNTIAKLLGVIGRVNEQVLEVLTKQVLDGTLSRRGLIDAVSGKSEIKTIKKKVDFEPEFKDTVFVDILTLVNEYALQILSDKKWIEKIRGSELGNICHTVSGSLERIFSEKFDKLYQERKTIDI